MFTWLTHVQATGTVEDVPQEPQVDKQVANALASRLRVLREASGMTQEAVAQRASMSRNHYQLLELGLSDRAKQTPANPRLTTLMEIAQALGCDVTALVDGL
jgi:transcriptional regulator with XRE-family HTH domain